MEKRKLTKEDIDKVRGIEGFPIGSDEDIIALSDAPYYTACPNPFIGEFIKENGKPYDEKTDDYHREPFASDVSEGKADPIYNAHTYHTKVPHKAIMRYILHYTKPGDIVLDGFCGTGMTGVAANMCGSTDNELRYQVSQGIEDAEWGKRSAILSDLSPIASLIAYNYNHETDVKLFEKTAKSILERCNELCGWMYETTPIQSSNQMPLSFGEATKVRANYTAWSDVLLCPQCGHELVFYDVAFDDETGKVADSFICPHCQARLDKKSCDRAITTYLDDATHEIVSVVKQVPVVVNYSSGRRKISKKPDKYDFAIIDKVENYRIDKWYPTDLMMLKGSQWGDSWRAGYHSGISRVHQFFYKRTLIYLSTLYDLIQKENMPLLKIWFTSQIINISKLNRYRPKVSFPYNPLSGTLYISSLICESNPEIAYEGKITKFAEALSKISTPKTVVSVNSATNILAPDNSIDYIFTDPPFGDNLMYSELSFMWEAWIRNITNNSSEAIMNGSQGKGILEYQELMTRCFIEYHRVLKPNRWMTVEFHNSKNAVWNAIQESLLRAGFIVADVRTLDKQSGSYKQVNNTSAVKQDLVISAYKPKQSLDEFFTLNAGSVDTAWEFVRQHLDKLPVVVTKNGKIELLTERQGFLLFDRMVAYHIMRGIAVPLDAADFYRGLDERFLKRDNMYFLPDQVNEYDMARSTCDVETIQFSLFVSDEKSAIGWLYQQLDANSGEGPQTYQDLMPKFMQELKAVDKREKMPELMEILEENFLKDEDGKWYIPDLTKSGDIAKLREKNLLKEFQEYLNSKGKLKVFRSEAIRAGFAKLWKDKDYAAIVALANRLPEETIQEDQNLLMYYDISLSRV